MKIAHISDLHYGRHNSLLASGLKARLKTLAPDIILCSGDVADDNERDLAEQALAYLEELAEACTTPAGPRLIVVPGNHDIRRDGWRFRGFSKNYARVFGEQDTHHYYEAENVWVFGFDSAEEGQLLGSGRIKDDDLDRFHQTYDTLMQEPRFASAFKIVLVHHHPLPVNWDNNAKDRWLTMTNAGRFLSAVLFRQVDLVLHGHEHLQARAQLWSTLGANNHQTTVVSLGTTLRQVQNPERNWFGWIEVDDNGARVKFYGSVGNATFHTEPDGETFWVRSPQAEADRAFLELQADRGMVYRAVASVALIDRDGDSRRSIECDDMRLLREPSDGTFPLAARIPHTSGYIDKVAASGNNGPRLVEPLPEGKRVHEFGARLIFDHKPVVNSPVDFTVRWHTVNSFAMDRRQFDHMYPDAQGKPLDNVEFTHYDVHDPIEQLTVIARFPEGFEPGRPRLRVVKLDDRSPSRSWENVPLVEEELAREYALRYFDSIHIAALRVRRPKVGLSYGIQWDLPVPPNRPVDQASNEITEIVDLLKRTPPSETQRNELATVLARILETSRELLAPGRKRWSGSLEASLMVFDAEQHSLRVAAAVKDERGRSTAVDFSDVTLTFGDGIAGRSFKTNQIRLYLQEADESDLPRHYRTLPNVPPHKVLISLPVQAPDEQVWPPYGVLNIGSTRADCPLRLIQPDTSEWQSKLSAFKREAEVHVHAALTRIFLDYEPDEQA